jgi:HAD superfamily hydrolase (TIGR01509 family)
LKAIIFDCDGVLIDSEWLASRVEAELLRDLGLKLSVEEVHELFLGKTVAGVLSIVAARSGITPAPEFTYNWAFATAHSFMRELQPIPYVRAALEELSGRGCRLAVASQSPLARVRLSLEVTGLAEFFGAHVYVTTMVPNPKPAPDIYLLAASRLGAAPGDCVVVEDSPAGAAAARGAGMHAIGYAPGATAEAMRATGIAVLRSMDELPGRIAALL